jgi:hypothetical protein
MRMSSLAEVTNASLRMHRHGAHDHLSAHQRCSCSPTGVERSPRPAPIIGVDLVYGEHVWPLAEPRTAGPRELPWAAILSALSDRGVRMYPCAVGAGARDQPLRLFAALIAELIFA